MTKHKLGSRTFSALIALVMVLAMFPVTTLAAVTTVAIDEATTTYDQATGVVTLNASISEYGADVTIVAVRTNEAIGSFGDFKVDSSEIIAYIDQVPSGADGKVTKTFKLRELAGTKLTIAVGGKDVSTPDLYTLSLAKSPATITVAESYVAGTKIGLGFEDDNGWEAAKGKVVKVNGDIVEAGIIVEDNTLYVGDEDSSVFGLEETETEETHILTIEVPGFDPVEKTVKVIAPTKATLDQLPANLSVAYEGDIATGAATVTLPTVANEYAPIAWQVDGDAATVSPDGKITLTRPESTAEEKTKTHVVKAVIEKEGYISQEKTYDVTVNREGVTGVDVSASINLGVAPAIAAYASISINGGEAISAKADGTFALGMLSPGTYEFTVKRPGYVTFTYSVEIGTEGITSVDGTAATALAPQMIAGDIVGDDGVIGFDDFMAFGSVYLKPDLAADFDASGTVGFEDFMTFGSNYLYNKNN